MLGAMRPIFWTMMTVAAPFTLLVDMAMTVFGPEPPKTIAAMTPRLVLILIVIPGLIGAIGQMAVARLVTEPGAAPRVALAAAFVAMPAYVLSLLVSAIPIGLGLMLLVLPGLYLAARLFLVVPLAATERLGAIALLERSWRLTAGHGVPIMGFLLLAVLFVLGASVLAGGIGAALGTVFKLVGLGAVGGFVNNLVAAVLATAIAVANAAAASVIYLRLRDGARA